MIMSRVAALLTAAVFALPAWAIDIEEVTSPGGIQAWLVQDDSIPFVAVEIWFRGGTSVDPEGKRGAVNLMVGLLEEGSGDLDAHGFATATEELAASFGFSAYRDSVVISAQMLTENRDAAVDLLRAAIIAPRFDADALERVRAQVLAGIEGDAQDPDEIAGATFNAMAFGGHPYATAGEGTTESVSALTQDDMFAAHQASFALDRVSVAAAGDITADELGALVDHLLADLPVVGATLPGPAPYLLEGGTTVVEFPTPQSIALFGHQGIERDDPDFFAAFVLNQILGGSGFRSRLMQAVRVDRGLTYGIYSYLALSDYAPMMMGQFSSSNDLVAEAVDLTRAQWADVAENGVTDAELAAAIRYMTGAYPLRFDGNDTIANIMAAMQSDQMPASYIEERNSYIEAVTQDDIRRVATRLLQPDRLNFVVVGQPQGLMTGN